KVNQGTTFNFSIPLEVKKQVHTNGDAALETKSASNGQNLSGRKILIAEDDEFIRFHYQMLFKDSGAKLEFAKNGKEAVDLFHNQSGFDLVLMDIRMPEKNGYEAMKEILQSKPDTVVFMQSAFAMQEEINKCFEAGCKGYFTKPVEEEKLFKTIKKWLN
ncbi:MAG TPA: response regulator, partial [Prolixibacteraceae bacterium]|nr:response regulator [Prolixibacteraceae bacterium]